jgi:hypothetical protein
MKSIDCFIVKPFKERYDNKVTIDGKELITNASIEDYKSISKKAVVVSTPLSFKSDIKKGDVVIIHHNIFRRFYDLRGKEKNGSLYFKDNTYFCDPSQIYMYQQGNTWYTNLEYCFVAPIKETSDFSLEKEQKHIGILKYGNKSLEELKIAPGDLIGYKPFGEFEFVIDGQRLYCMKSNDIVIKYEYKGNEKEYNPGWAKSR